MSGVFDVAVIGGGPAGASAAITGARIGLEVVLFEAGSLPRHRVCGEFVSGEGLALLNTLLGSNDLITRAPRISRARVFIDDRVLEFPVQPAAASISRHTLDLFLWRVAISIGIDARLKSQVRSCRRVGDYFVLQTAEDDVQARAVINATGRWSNLARGRHKLREHWLGVKSHFVESRAPHSCDLYFFEGGYCGVQPLGNDKVNVAAMVRADIARTMPEILRQNRSLALRSCDWKPQMEPVTTSPLIFRPPQTSQDGVALCGDAAAFLDPFAGDGISIALHSGRMAAIELATYAKSQRSLESALASYDRLYRALLQPALKNAARLRRIIHLPRLGRIAAISLLKFPPLARLAVEQTRARYRRAG